MLTDKAKNDFELWYLKYKSHHDKLTVLDSVKINQLYNLDQTCIDALVVEWLDSVGIYVNVSANYIDHERKYSEGDFKAVINFRDGSLTKGVDLPLEYCFKPISRLQVTKHAVEQANKIYNER